MANLIKNMDCPHKGQHHFVFGLCATLFFSWVVLVFSVCNSTAQDGTADYTPIYAYDLRIAGDEKRMRVVISFDQAPTHSLQYMANPERIIINLPPVAFSFDNKKLKKSGLFRSIRYGSVSTEKSRIIIETTSFSKVDFFELQKSETTDEYRMILDIVAVKQAEHSLLVAKNIENMQNLTVKRGPRIGAGQSEQNPQDEDSKKNGESENQEFTVFLDPGHGGIDGGARGQRGIVEKNVTLLFANTLREELLERIKQDNNELKIKVVMSRESDVFVSLSDRVQSARKNSADLFISIHADTVRQKRVRGATFYTLSDEASDDISAELAKRENRVDEIAGISIGETKPVVADILIDLMRRETALFSVNLAKIAISKLKGRVKLIKNPHRFAGFKVLRAPEIPSILFELGYLSNASDEKLLKNKKWIKSTAALIVDAVVEFRNITRGIPLAQN